MEICYKLSESTGCWPSLLVLEPICSSMIEVPVYPRSHGSEELKYVCNLAITDDGKVTGSLITLLLIKM